MGGRTWRMVVAICLAPLLAAPASASASEWPTADLSVAVESSTSELAPGEQFTVSVTIESAGPDAAPPRLFAHWNWYRVRLVSMDAPDAALCEEFSIAVDCLLGELAAGASTVVGLTFVSKRPGTTGIAFETYHDGADDPDFSNNDQGLEIDVTGDPYLADVRAEVTFDRPAVGVGQTSMAAITVHNDGPHSAADGEIDVRWASGAVTGGTVQTPADVRCSERPWRYDGEDRVTCFLPELEPGGVRTVRIPLRALRLGHLDVQATSFYVDEIGPSNDSATARLAVVDLPSAPQRVSGRGLDRAIRVRWEPPADDGGSAVTYRASAGGRSCVTTGLACTIDGLANGTPYELQVVARNAAGSSTATSSRTRVMPLARPSAPTEVELLPRWGAIRLTWHPPRDDGGAAITGYEVRVAPGRAMCATRRTTCVVRGLERTTYAFTVRARNAAGFGDPSARLEATPR